MLLGLQDLLPMLRCPLSGRPLEQVSDRLSAGAASFRIVQGIPVLLPRGGDSVSAPTSYKKRESRLRKTFGRLFVVSNLPESLRATRSVISQAAKSECTLIIVGGGSLSTGLEVLYRSKTCRVIAFDIYASANTNLVADGHHIPLTDCLADYVLVQAVLEHVISPEQVVSEIWRVLRPGGVVLADTPFMYPVHEGAYDFTRFSGLGHRWLFRKFEEVASGPSLGVGAAALIMARYFLQAVTRSKKIGGILWLPLSPLRLADRFIPRKAHMDAGGGYYFVGRRSEQELTKENLIASYQGAQ